MATTISVIGLLLAAIIFVVAIWKGLDVFTSTILVSFIIILTSWMDWWTSLSSYAEGYVGFIQNNVFVLVIGAVFGELMAASQGFMEQESQRKWVQNELSCLSH